MSSDLSHLPGTPQLSVMLYQNGTIDQLRADADECIAAGIDTLYIPDHIIGGGNADQESSSPWLAMTPLLLDIAARHPQTRVGNLVASPSLRSAAQLCVEAATVASIIGKERLLVSIGAGGAHSDQLHQHEELSASDKAQRFAHYIDDVMRYRLGDAPPYLRLASDFDIRVASDSPATIDVVAKANTAWVTSGGFKKTLDYRIERINTLWDALQSQSFTGKVAVCADSIDGLTYESSPDDVAEYASQYSCPIDEVIVTLFKKR